MENINFYIWDYITEKLTMLKRKRSERIIEDTILLLYALTEGQRSAQIEIFDAGAGGGFQSGHLLVDHMRDGKLIDRKVYDLQELKELILEVLEVTDSGLPLKILNDSNWRKYMARAEA